MTGDARLLQVAVTAHTSAMMMFTRSDHTSPSRYRSSMGDRSACLALATGSATAAADALILLQTSNDAWLRATRDGGCAL